MRPNNRPITKQINEKFIKKLILCGDPGKQTFSALDYSKVRDQLAEEYYSFVSANFDKHSLDQVNFGDDMYLNGTLDDSDYDLLIDIEKL